MAEYQVQFRYVYPDDIRWSLVSHSPHAVHMRDATRVKWEKLLDESSGKSSWTREPLAYDGMPATINENVPEDTIWFVREVT